ncbi:hypothetical protein E8E13_003738 [Curvularia kusanoi]|uniref:Maintenance of telomere capping protein 6 n=1 Tax=Curvularia kusanoi TaxID=90978 RepID=A0A9P4TAR9_CURKU|nr:hypothetical protein E8E13_003738 [Curvularia kusanoi]
MPQPVKVRQADSLSSLISSIWTSSSGPGSSALSAAPSASAQPIISYPTTKGPPLLQIGRYNCTSQMTFGLLTGLLEDFLDETATTTGATITFLNLNIHAAATLADPDQPAPLLSQAQVPQSDDTLSAIVKGNLSSLLYTPATLAEQRADLNSSWYDVEWDNIPAGGYYSTSKNTAGNVFTESGWPTEALMEFQQFKRVIVGFGTVDKQMEAYNINDDLSNIFPPGTITRERQVSFASDGQVDSGCYFPSSTDAVTSEFNASFARATPPSINAGQNPDLMSPILSVSNLTRCGIVPFLNQSLAGTTADKNPLPYAAYVHSTLWSWAPGQPLNATRASSTANRCVVMTNSPYPGRWEVGDCATRLRAACQDPGKPYYWEVSADKSEYTSAETLCRSPLQFAVPHTALENEYLYAAWQRSSAPDEPVFVDLNQLGTADCWVIGINGTCPYLQSTDTNRTRIVVVPTIAAVIIFVCAALTFFIKCASNRREDRRGRGRKMLDGWEYEGVPS